jgi:hypothetical protein
MLAVYLTALVAGGALLGLSFLAGDGHGGGHAGHGVDAHAGDHGGLDVVLGWLPITSLRFWIVAAAFFGLTGTALSLAELLGEPARGGLAGVVGWAAGVFVTGAMRRLTSAEVSSAVGDRDLIGASAVVLIPIGRGAPGKVRVRMKDRAIDLPATTDDADTFATGAEVLIYATVPAGGVVVTRGPAPDRERSGRA